jgi:hypothetical protein
MRLRGGGCCGSKARDDAEEVEEVEEVEIQELDDEEVKYNQRVWSAIRSGKKRELAVALKERLDDEMSAMIKVDDFTEEQR